RDEARVEQLDAGVGFPEVAAVAEVRIEERLGARPSLAVAAHGEVHAGIVDPDVGGVVGEVVGAGAGGVVGRALHGPLVAGEADAARVGGEAVMGGRGGALAALGGGRVAHGAPGALVRGWRTMRSR